MVIALSKEAQTLVLWLFEVLPEESDHLRIEVSMKSDTVEARPITANLHP